MSTALATQIRTGWLNMTVKEKTFMVYMAVMAVVDSGMNFSND